MKTDHQQKLDKFQEDKAAWEHVIKSAVWERRSWAIETLAETLANIAPSKIPEIKWKELI